MIPWTLLATASVPGTSGNELRLYQHGDDFSIRLHGAGELMTSREFHSEQALARMAIQLWLEARTSSVETTSPRILIGGLGMGFTLAAALKALDENTPSQKQLEPNIDSPNIDSIDVIELVREIVDWNHGPLGACTSYPVRDPRVRTIVADVTTFVRQDTTRYDIILLDVDNGPDAFTKTDNNSLYSSAGLKRLRERLAQCGILGVWSAAPDERFTRRLQRAGFRVVQRNVRSRGTKGARHTLWFGIREEVA